MKIKTDNKINPDAHLRENAVSGCTGHFLTEAVNALVYKTPNKILEIVRPTLYEKNNLPEDVRIEYCDIIEKYQKISYYENGIIDKNELIKFLRNDN